MTNPRVSFAKFFEKDRILLHSVSKCLVLSYSTTFYKGKSHILENMKAFTCTEGSHFKVYKHSQVLFPGRKIYFSVDYYAIECKFIYQCFNSAEDTQNKSL